MPCLFACFSISKHKKRRFFIKANSSLEPRRDADGALLEATKVENQEDAEKTSDPIKIPNLSMCYDHESVSAYVICCDELFRAKCKGQVRFCAGKKDSSALVSDTCEEFPVKAISVELIEQNGVEEDGKRGEEHKGTRLVPESSHRSQNCSRACESFKDSTIAGPKEVDDSDGEKDRNFVMEEQSESLFSLSIESRKRVSEVDFGGEKEVTSPITKKEIVSRMMETKLIEDSDQNAFDQVAESVFNPIQNITDWKTFKVKKVKLPEAQEKENIGVQAETLCQEPILNLSSKKKLVDQEITVDTSLSSWLVESEGTSQLSRANSTNSVGNSASKSKNSPNSNEDRRVLEELNLQEPKQGFVSKSSKRGQSLDDVPMKGTIGSYWSCTKQIENRIAAV